MDRFFLLAGFIFMLAGQAVAQQSNSYDLKNCVETALQNNFNVKQAEVALETARLGARQAWLNLLPNLNGGFGYGLNQGRNLDPITNVYINQELQSSGLNLSSNWVLFNGFRLHNLLAQSTLTRNSVGFDVQQAKDLVALNVVMAFFQVLSAEDQIAMAKGQLEVTRKQAERVAAQVKEGVVGSFQLADLQGQKANEEVNILTQENAMRQARLSLCQLMNIPFDTELQLERLKPGSEQIPYPASSKAVFLSAQQHMAVFKANELRVKVAETAVAVSRAGYLPTVSLTGSMGTSYSSLSSRLIPVGRQETATGGFVRINGIESPVLSNEHVYASEKVGYVRQFQNNLGVFAGISVQVPLFNGFQTYNQVSLARNNLRRAQFLAGAASQEMQQNIEQAWLNSDAAARRAELFGRQVAEYQISFAAAEVRLQNGVIQTAEFLIAKNNLDRAKTAQVNARYEYLFRTKILDYYQGKPLW